jgi:hypothetical protein
MPQILILQSVKYNYGETMRISGDATKICSEVKTLYLESSRLD